LEAQPTVVLSDALLTNGLQGWTAIYLGGGNRTLLTPVATSTSANHVAFANHVHHFGRVIWSYKPGFSLSTHRSRTHAHDPLLYANVSAGGL
jgi:hypothetical protein